LQLYLVFFSGRTGLTPPAIDKLHDQGAEVRVCQVNKLTVLGEKTYYLVSEGKTLDEALANYEHVANGKLDSLVKCGDVTKVNGVAIYCHHLKFRRRKLRDGIHSGMTNAINWFKPRETGPVRWLQSWRFFKLL
jgi:hypothetical protein